MVYSNVEIVALIFSVIVIIKVLITFFNPSFTVRLQKSLFSFPKLVSWVSVILACIILSFLLREITITQIFLSGMFILLIIVSGIAVFNKEIIILKESIISKFKVKDYWWYLVMWLILVVWVLEEILTK